MTSTITDLLNRRTFLAGSMAGATVLIGGSAMAQEATLGATPVEDHGHEDKGEDQRFLAVADPVAELVSVFALPEMALVDRLEGVAVNAHVGFIPLADGQLLFVDDMGKRLIALEVHGDHFHTHEAQIAGETFSHIAIDSVHADVAAVGSDDADAPITLVDLETWETVPVAIPEPGEVGLLMSHDYLFHRNSNLNQIEAYLLADVMAGVVGPVSKVPIGPGGHGEAITMHGDKLYAATDEGIDVVGWDGQALTYLTTYSWNSADRSGGRGYFQRLSFGGGTLVSYTADRSAPETEWDTWANDALLVDTADGITRRFDLGNGYVYRFGLSATTALFTRIGGDGDEAIVLDIASGEVGTRIPLEPMIGGPIPGESIWDANQYRSVAMTPDGSLGFVTNGGDGTVTVLDLNAGVVLETFEAGSPLDGGGALAVFGTAQDLTDLIGR
jgi:WD40 repeat protein